MRSRSAAPRARRRSSDVGFNYERPRRDTLERHLASTPAPGQVRRDRRPDRRRQEHARQPAPALLRPAARAHPARRPRHPRAHAAHRCAQQISVVLQEPLLFSGHDRGQHPLRPAGRDRRTRSSRRRRRPTPTTSSRGCRRATTPSSASAGRSCPAASGSASAVARAFLKDAPILILDEPTSSIDSKTEAVILDALDRLMVGRTTFMIAHRLSTVRRADLILVLDQRPDRRAGHARGVARAAAACTGSSTTLQTAAARRAPTRDRGRRRG